jgi:hypothetical protein
MRPRMGVDGYGRPAVELLNSRSSVQPRPPPLPFQATTCSGLLVSDIDVDVDPVDRRARDALLVARDNRWRAGAAALRILKIAAWAVVHRCNQHEGRGKGADLTSDGHQSCADAAAHMRGVTPRGARVQIGGGSCHTGRGTIASPSRKAAETPPSAARAGGARRLTAVPGAQSRSLYSEVQKG